MNSSKVVAVFAGLSALSLLAGGCGRSNEPAVIVEQHDRYEAPDIPPAGGETKVEMVNVKVRLDPELILHIRRLAGKLVPTRKDRTPTFDDNRSYVIAVESAEISISAASMTYMMNKYVFPGPDAPIRNLKITTKGKQLKQVGTLKKKVGVSFESISDISPTPDGKIRIHATEMKAARVPVKGLMKLLGLDMAGLISTKHAVGIEIDDNDIIMDPALAFPPPNMRGRVTAVWIEGDDIVQRFGTTRALALPAKPPSNYMAYRGGVLKFGKLTMTETDLRLEDDHPADPFDFYPNHYNDHLVGGYSKTTRSGGLIVYMPDYSRMAHTTGK